jgi:NAD(P)H-hydrate epimerase
MACTDFIHHKYLKTQNILIFCGNGNNGGDGLAMARLLYQKGFDVDVFMDKSKKELSKDAEINYHRLKEFLGIRILDFTDFNEGFINEDSIIVDALFGTGLNRKIEGEVAKIIISFKIIVIT